jgi:hypothetical protein
MIEAMKQALEALEKLWDIIDDIDTYGDMAKNDDKLYRSLVERRQRQRFEQTGISTDGYELNGGAITSLRQAIEEAEKQEQWIETDMAYRPGGIPLDFIQHEVDSPNDWSEWVCPKPSQYFMKCCDCGLVHEMQFKVAKYAEGDECEFVEDADTQAVFRARRASPTKREWVGLSEEEIDKLKHLIDWTATWSHGRFAYEIEQLLKEKNA